MKYAYDKAINGPQLAAEIMAASGPAIPGFQNICHDGTGIDTNFTVAVLAALTAPEKTQLDAVVTAHVPA